MTVRIPCRASTDLGTSRYSIPHLAVSISPASQIRIGRPSLAVTWQNKLFIAAYYRQPFADIKIKTSNEINSLNPFNNYCLNSTPRHLKYPLEASMGKSASKEYISYSVRTIPNMKNMILSTWRSKC